MQVTKRLSDPNTNRNFAEHSLSFRLACEAAGVRPTKRQASKWRNGRGLAYEAHRKLVAEQAKGGAA